MCCGTREIDAAIASCREHRAVGTEAMQRAVVQVPGQQAPTTAIIIHQEIEREILDVELGAVLQALLIERVQDGMAGAVGRRTGALRHLLAIADGLTAEGTLIDFSILEAERADRRDLRDIFAGFRPMAVPGLSRQDDDAARRIGLYLLTIELLAESDIEHVRHDRIDAILRVLVRH